MGDVMGGWFRPQIAMNSKAVRLRTFAAFFLCYPKILFAEKHRFEASVLDSPDRSSFQPTRQAFHGASLLVHLHDKPLKQSRLG